MVNWIIASALWWVSFPVDGTPPTGTAQLPPPEDLEKVILVDVDISTTADAAKCYAPTFDKKRVEVQVEFDDPLNNLTDFVMESDPIESADCFLPEMKIIYTDYTYVISLYCGSVVKYKNSAAYTPSNLKVANDLEVTEELLQYLRNKHKQYFGPYNPAISSRLCPGRKIADVSPEPGDDPLLGDDKDPELDELGKEAQDKEGWFSDLPTEDDKEIIPDDE